MIRQWVRRWLGLDKEVHRKLDAIIQQGIQIMTVETDIQAAVADIAAEVITLGTDADNIIKALIDAQQADGGIPAADAAALLASLQAVSTNAKAVGGKLEAAVTPPAPPAPAPSP